MAKKPTAMSVSEAKGKRVFFGGRVSEKPRFTQALETLGATVVDTLDAKVDWMILGRTGFGGAEKAANKLIANDGAVIESMSESDLIDRLKPTPDEFEALLRAGKPGVERLNAIASLAHNAWTLTGLDLQGADLSGLNCFGLTFEGCDLRKATFTGASYLQLVGCRLEGAMILGCHLYKLEKCDLSGLDLTAGLYLQPIGSNLSRCRFAKAHLFRWNFTSMILDEVDFSGAFMREAILTGCALSGVNFAGANLSAANLVGADLRGVNLTNANLEEADLTDAKIDGADFTGANLRIAKLGGLDLSKAKGAVLPPPAKATAGAAVNALAQAAQSAEFVGSNAEVVVNGSIERLSIYFHGSSFSAGDAYVMPVQASHTDAGKAWQKVVDKYARGKLDPSSVTVNTRKSTIAKKDLKALALAAWCELFETPVPSDEDIKAAVKAKSEAGQEVYEQWAAKLRSDGGAEWNALSRWPFTKWPALDLSNANLPALRFQSMECREGNFASAQLEKSVFMHATLVDADFSKAKLGSAMFDQANLAGAKFVGADLSGVTFASASLKNAVFSKAKMINVDLTNADLRGADFTDAKWKDGVLTGAKFDQNTKLPAGVAPTLEMKWVGEGPSPLLATLKKMRAKEPLNIEDFMKRLESHSDKSKLDKSLKMLKADRFKLYAQVTDEHLVGVVKSQGDPNLVYSCKLAADGVYGCCTQNLNICGGLRGSLCKHLLVLIVGLTKNGEIDPNLVDTWVLASKSQKPLLDKDAMSATFLRYKGAEAGEVDWRPTETIPEDYYAL